jgi:hypothetical protein
MNRATIGPSCYSRHLLEQQWSRRPQRLRPKPVGTTVVDKRLNWLASSTTKAIIEVQEQAKVCAPVGVVVPLVVSLQTQTGHRDGG